MKGGSTLRPGRRRGERADGRPESGVLWFHARLRSEATLPPMRRYREHFGGKPDFSRRKVALALKRVFDVAGAGIGLVVLAPLLLLIALTIRLADGGPALFKQDRTGRGGQRFTIFKFRSIYRRHCDPSGLTPAEARDEHLLPMGHFLRRTGLDELPQLLNIVLGDMSLVGPRPHVPDMLVAGTPYRTLVACYDRRTDMRPGLTGWAQCRGLRGPVLSREMAVARIDHDLAYIENFSIRLDLEILVGTAIYILCGKTAGPDMPVGSPRATSFSDQTALWRSRPGPSD
ncbi:MAG: sugar transferase [Devosia sp.]|nr:sugar transferase [Devosia sp.]